MKLYRFEPDCTERTCDAAQSLGVELYGMKMTEFGLDADPAQDST